MVTNSSESSNLISAPAIDPAIVVNGLVTGKYCSRSTYRFSSSYKFKFKSGWTNKASNKFQTKAETATIVLQLQNPSITTAILVLKLQH